MWILPNHKSDLDLNTVCELFEKSVLYRSKPSSAKTWKKRFKSKIVAARRVSKSTLNTDLLKSKCLQVSKNHQVEINEFNEEEFKEWTNFNKIEYKVRSNFQKQIWATPTTRDYKGTQGRTNKEESLGDLPGQTEGPWSTWKSDLPQHIKKAKQLSKKLNPRWVENLMGVPIGWVNAKAYMNESEEN